LCDCSNRDLTINTFHPLTCPIFNYHLLLFISHLSFPLLVQLVTTSRLYSVNHLSRKNYLFPRHTNQIFTTYDNIYVFNKNNNIGYCFTNTKWVVVLVVTDLHHQQQNTMIFNHQDLAFHMWKVLKTEHHLVFLLKKKQLRKCCRKHLSGRNQMKGLDMKLKNQSVLRNLIERIRLKNRSIKLMRSLKFLKFVAWVKVFLQSLSMIREKKKKNLAKGSTDLPRKCAKTVPFPVREESLRRGSRRREGRSSHRRTGMLGRRGLFRGEIKWEMVEWRISLTGETPAKFPAGDLGRRLLVPTMVQRDLSWVGAYLQEKQTNRREREELLCRRTVAGKWRIQQWRVNGHLQLMMSRWKILLCHWNASSFFSWLIRY